MYICMQLFVVSFSLYLCEFVNKTKNLLPETGHILFHLTNYEIFDALFLETAGLAHERTVKLT